MAGGYIGKQNSKVLKKGQIFSSEVLKDSQDSYYAPKPDGGNKFSLRGILGLGQSVEFNKPQFNTENHQKEVFNQISHLQQEQNILFNQHQKELKRALEELRAEIQKLIKVTGNLDKDVENIVVSQIVDINEYQLNFFTRIRNFITNMRQNINQAGIWVESFTAKKKKRNMFWNNVKNKKKGGEQYLFSNEHSAARSVS